MALGDLFTPQDAQGAGVLGAPAALSIPSIADVPPPAAPPPQGGFGQAMGGLLNGVGNALGGVLALPGQYANAMGSQLGGVAESWQMKHLQDQYVLAMMHQKMAGLGALRDSLPASEQKVFDSDPIAYSEQMVKNRALQNMKPGESLGGAQGLGPTAPIMGIDEKSGVGFTQTPGGIQQTGQFGGDFSAGPSGITSGRTGQFQPITQPVTLAPGSGLSAFQPSTPGQPSAPNLPPSPPISGPSDVDSLVRMAYGEDQNNPQAVAAVALNRAKAMGVPVSTIVNAPGQFEGMNARAKALDPNSAAYRTIAMNLQPLISGQAPDPTGGATSFYSPALQAQLGRARPSFDDGTGQQIGSQLYFKTPPNPSWAGMTQTLQGSAVPGVPSAQTLVQGKTNVPIPPAQAQQMGLAPGVWAMDPTNKPVQVSAPPKEDMDRLGSMGATLDTLRSLQANQQKFMTLNQQPQGQSTGLKYMDMDVHGHDVNPFVANDLANNPAINGMHALAQSQVLMVKPANAGARILQSELPLWQQAVQGIDKSPGVNQQILQDTNNRLREATIRHAFYNSWVYNKGTLDGADQAFDHYRSTLPGAGSLASGAQQMAQQGPAPMRPTAPPQPGQRIQGYTFLGGDPANPANWRQ